MPKPHIDTSRRRVPASGKTASVVAAEVPAVLALLASGDSHSGPGMAQRLGISRAAVWKQVTVLRNLGLDIQSGDAGYRLTQPLEWLDPAAIRSCLPAVVRRRVGAIENHWRLDSTSSECLRRVGELPDRSFVFADWQSAGRGRRGRQWVSPPATNLQFSCFKRFPGGYASLAGLSLAAGVAVAQALEDCGAGAVGLKWPNDLMHADAKLGGILVELGGEFMGPCHAVIGIGINMRVSEAMSRMLDRPCTDIGRACGGAAPSRNVLAAALVSRLVDALDVFADSGFPAFADAWGSRDALVGRTIRVEGAHGIFEGTAAGVDARGALRVRRGGAVECLDSAEITVRSK
jgi:BirA family biotin operon repressor/biotin-[acetyl-CoA-carboxylase] ligase